MKDKLSSLGRTLVLASTTLCLTALPGDDSWAQAVPDEINVGAGTESTQATPITGEGGLTKTGGGTYVINQNNTYTGATTVSAGTLTLDGANGALSATSSVTVDAGATLNIEAGNSDRINSDADLTVNGNLNVKSTESVGALSGTNASAVVNIAADRTLYVEQGKNTTFAGKLTGSEVAVEGVAGKTGSLNLTGDNRGLTKLNIYNSFDSAKVTVSVSQAQNLAQTIALGGNATLEAIETFAYDGNVTSGSGGVGVIQVSRDKTLTLSGAISGSNLYVKKGAGTLALAGTNTRTSLTVVDGGTLSIAKSDHLGSGGLALRGGTLQAKDTFALEKSVQLVLKDDTLGNRYLQQNITEGSGNGGAIDVVAEKILTLGGTISGTTDAAHFTKTGSGTLVLTGTNTYAGNTNINGGILQVDTMAKLGADSNALIFDGGTLAVTSNAQTISKAITLNTNGGSFLVGGTNTLTITSAITGTGSLTKSGAGTQVLTADNTYMGNTNINGGILQVDTMARLGAANNALIFDGGTLAVTGNAQEITKAITLNTGGGGFLVDGTNNLIITSAITGTGSLTKTGGGTLLLTAENTYTGATKVSAGTLTVGGQDTNSLLSATSSVTVDAGATLNIEAYSYNRINDNADMTVNGNLNVKNYETVGALSGTNASAVVNIIADSSLTLVQGKDTTFAGKLTGGTVDVQGVAGKTGSLNLTGNNRGLDQLNIFNNYGAGQVTVSVSQAENLARRIELSAGGTLEAIETFAYDRNVSVGPGGGVIQVSRDKTLTLSGTILGTQPLVKKGGGTLSITGENTTTGLTVVDDGTLSIAEAAKLGSGNLALRGGALQAKDTFDLNKSIQLVLKTDTLGNDGLQNYITEGSGNGGAIDVVAEKTLTLSGAISGTASTAHLTKTGSGTLVLSAENTYNGDTHINGGILQVDTEAKLGNASNALAFNGGTLAVTSDAQEITKAITLNTGGGSFLVGGTNTLTITSAITGTGSLTKSGSGTQVLTGNNTYTGDTHINGGILQVDTEARLGTGNALTFDGGTLAVASNNQTIMKDITLNTGGGSFLVDGTNSLTISSAITGTGSLTKTGNGTLLLIDGTAVRGATIIDQGKLVLASGNSDRLADDKTVTLNGELELHNDETIGGLSGGASGTVTSVAGMSATRTLTLNTTGTSSYAGRISGPTNITKSGSGTQTFSGSGAASTGLLAVNGGTFGFSEEASWGGPITIASAATLKANTSGTLGGTITASGTLDVARNTSAGGNVTIQKDGTLQHHFTATDVVTKLTTQGALTMQSGAKVKVVTSNDTFIKLDKDYELAEANDVSDLTGVELDDGSEVKMGTLSRSSDNKKLLITYSVDEEEVDEGLDDVLGGGGGTGGGDGTGGGGDQQAAPERVGTITDPDKNIAEFARAIIETPKEADRKVLSEVGLSTSARVKLLEQNDAARAATLRSMIPSNSPIDHQLVETISTDARNFVLGQIITPALPVSRIPTRAAPQVARQASPLSAPQSGYQRSARVPTAGARADGQNQEIVLFDNGGTAVRTVTPLTRNWAKDELSRAPTAQVNTSIRSLNGAVPSTSSAPGGVVKPLRVFGGGLGGLVSIREHTEDNTLFTPVEGSYFGGLLGADYLVNNATRVGAFATAGISNSKETADMRKGTTSGTSFGGGLFASFSRSNLSFSAITTAQYVSRTTSRSVDAFDDLLEGSWSGFYGDVLINGSFNVIKRANYTVSAFAAGGASMLMQPQFTEQGEEVYLVRTEYTRITGFGELGMNAGYVLDTASMQLVPSVSLSGGYKVRLSDDPTYKLGESGVLAKLTESTGQNLSGKARLSLAGSSANGLSFELNGQGIFSAVHTEFGGGVTVGFSF